MNAPLRLLLVEDSADDADVIVRHLQRGGYQVAFERVDSRDGLSRAIEQRGWDLVICDYCLPQFSGPDALKLLREKGLEAPFIFVSGTMGEGTAVTALKLGAQDYVMKGSLGRLIPAIERELREAEEKRGRLQLEQRLRQLERFEAIGQLAGGVAHDFNNIVGAILGWAQLGVADAASSPGVRERFRKIRDEAQRASGLTAQLLAFARRQVLQPKKLNLNDSIAGVATLLKSALGDQIEFKTVLSPDLSAARADPIQIDQVLMNLCLNARDAMPTGGRLVIETRVTELGADFCRIHSYGVPGKYVMLLVSDTGMGMDDATIKRLFEPFFTTKELGRGTGLGLATVYGIVKQHEGFINVYSELGRGTTFHVYFPADSGTPDRRDSTATTEVSGRNETVLVADDHEGLRDIAQEFLTTWGYKVILARDGEEAVRLYRENQGDIQLVVLDVMMPRLSGPEAYGQISRITPGLPVVFTTGHTAEASLLNPAIGGGALFLQKPYSPQELGRIIRAALDRTRSA